MNDQQKVLRHALNTLLTGVCHIADLAADLAEWELIEGDDPDPGEEAPEEVEVNNVRAIAREVA